MCNVLTIFDLALQMSYYKIKKKLHWYVLTQKKVIYAMEMGKCSIFFSCGNISAKAQWFNCISVV